jgi:hypothetical protein
MPSCRDESPSARSFYSPFRLPTALLVFFLLSLLAPLASLFLAYASPTAAASARPRQLDRRSQLLYVNAHPYLENPPDQLIQRFPELHDLRPSADQQALDRILSNTSRSVEAYFDNLVDLVAQEEIDQQRLNAKGAVKQKRHREYSYLILLHRDETPARLEEYRTDSQGNPVDQSGSNVAFNTTSGFALICAHFLPDNLPDSAFRYLGNELLDSRNTYVVAFAQLPDRATPTNFVGGEWGSEPFLVQGIAWIDQNTFQIIRIRTDLLAPRNDVGLAVESTEVTFNEVHLPDSSSPLLVPYHVTVSSEYRGNAYRNDHFYSDYRHFHVSAKMVPQ